MSTYMLLYVGVDLEGCFNLKKLQSRCAVKSCLPLGQYFVLNVGIRIARPLCMCGAQAFQHVPGCSALCISGLFLI